MLLIWKMKAQGGDTPYEAGAGAIASGGQRARAAQSFQTTDEAENEAAEVQDANAKAIYRNIAAQCRQMPSVGLKNKS